VLSDQDGRFVFPAVTQAAPLLLAARHSAGELGFLVDFDPRSEREARVIVAPTGFITLNREHSLRSADCWLLVHGPDQCTITASRWTKGPSTLIVEDLPAHLGALDLELHCATLPVIKRSTTITPAGGVDLWIASP